MRTAAYLFAFLVLCGCGQGQGPGQSKPVIPERPHERNDVVCVDIPAGSVVEAMQAFGEQARISFFYPPKAPYNQTRAMKKCGAIESLLKELLANTGLELVYLPQTHDGSPVFITKATGLKPSPPSSK